MSSPLEGAVLAKHKKGSKGREAEIVGKAGQGPRRIMGYVSHKWSHSFVVCPSRGGGEDPELGRKSFDTAFPTVLGY